MTISSPQVLLIDDDNDLRHALLQALELDGMNVKAFASAASIVVVIRREYVLGLR